MRFVGRVVWACAFADTEDRERTDLISVEGLGHIVVEEVVVVVVEVASVAAVEVG